MATRQIVLDTETTGLDPAQGHRIIEIGCVELIDRKFTHNNFHYYLNPEREIDAGAMEVHGITNEFLRDKPRFDEIQVQLLEYLNGAELVIHNAAFDISFLDSEYGRLQRGDIRIADYCDIVDSLQLARKQHPGQKNSLDALCKRYGIDNSQRTLHGALLDAEILADVYLTMTGGQTALRFEFDTPKSTVVRDGDIIGGGIQSFNIKSIKSGDEDVKGHREWLDMLGERSIWP